MSVFYIYVTRTHTLQLTLTPPPFFHSIVFLVLNMQLVLLSQAA